MSNSLLVVIDERELNAQTPQSFTYLSTGSAAASQRGNRPLFASKTNVFKNYILSQDPYQVHHPAI